MQPFLCYVIGTLSGMSRHLFMSPQGKPRCCMWTPHRGDFQQLSSSGRCNLHLLSYICGPDMPLGRWCATTRVTQHLFPEEMNVISHCNAACSRPTRNNKRLCKHLRNRELHPSLGRPRHLGQGSLSVCSLMHYQAARGFEKRCFQILFPRDDHILPRLMKLFFSP